jgi:hypothetical protein
LLLLFVASFFSFLGHYSAGSSVGQQGKGEQMPKKAPTPKKAPVPELSYSDASRAIADYTDLDGQWRTGGRVFAMPAHIFVREIRKAIKSAPDPRWAMEHVEPLHAHIFERSLTDMHYCMNALLETGAQPFWRIPTEKEKAS